MASRKIVLVGIFVLALMLGVSPAMADPFDADQVVWYQGGSDLNAGDSALTLVDHLETSGVSLGIDGFAIFAFPAEDLIESAILTLHEYYAGYDTNASVYVASSSFTSEFNALMAGSSSTLTTYNSGDSQYDDTAVYSNNGISWDSLIGSGGAWDGLWTYAADVDNSSGTNTVDLLTLTSLRPTGYVYVAVVDKASANDSAQSFDLNRVTVEGNSEVPEPASMLLFGSAAGLLGYFRRRQVKKGKVEA